MDYFSYQSKKQRKSKNRWDDYHPDLAKQHEKMEVVEASASTSIVQRIRAHWLNRPDRP